MRNISTHISTHHEAKISGVFGKALIVAKIRGRMGDLLSYRAKLELLLSNRGRLLVCLHRSVVNANKGISADLRSYALMCLLDLLRVHIKHDL